MLANKTKKSLLKLLPDLNVLCVSLVPCPLRPPVVCVYRKNPIQRRRLMALSLHAYRSASASAARPFDERRAGRRISSSVRPSVPHQMTPPPPNRPTSLWDFTRRPKVSRSFGPARLNCYNFSVAAVLREKFRVQTFLSVTTASHLGVGALVGNNSRTLVGFWLCISEYPVLNKYYRSYCTMDEYAQGRVLQNY